MPDQAGAWFHPEAACRGRSWVPRSRRWRGWCRLGAVTGLGWSHTAARVPGLLMRVARQVRLVTDGACSSLVSSCLAVALAVALVGILTALSSVLRSACIPAMRPCRYRRRAPDVDGPTRRDRSRLAVDRFTGVPAAGSPTGGRQRQLWQRRRRPWTGWVKQGSGGPVRSWRAGRHRCAVRRPTRMTSGHPRGGGRCGRVLGPLRAYCWDWCRTSCTTWACWWGRRWSSGPAAPWPSTWWGCC